MRVPRFLWEIHGRETTATALVMTYLAGILFAIAAYVLGKDLEPAWFRWLVAVMALDLGGGMVANMTRGTSTFYAGKPALSLTFLLLHLFYVVLFWLLFSPQLEGLWIGLAIVFTAIGIMHIRKAELKRTLAILAILILILTLALLALPSLLATLLLVFGIKLILAFAGGPWYRGVDNSELRIPNSEIEN